MGPVRTKVRLAPWARAFYDRLRAVHPSPKAMARVLGVTEGVVVQLDHGGVAIPTTVARVEASLGALLATAEVA